MVSKNVWYLKPYWSLKHIQHVHARDLQLRINMLAVTSQHVAAEFYKFLEIQRQGQDSHSEVKGFNMFQQMVYYPEHCGNWFLSLRD